MKLKLLPCPTKRRGVVVILVAVLMIPLVAMVAFAVDLAWIVLTETDLQNAADAAALAGADQLTASYVQYYLPGQTLQSTILSTAQTNARTYAKKYAAFNGAGGVTSLVLNDSDIEFGYTDAKSNYTSLASYTGYPNTIKVTLRRDNQANAPLSLFFGPALGTKQVNLQASAAATIYTGVVDSFVSNPPQNIKILPMTLDVNRWNSFLKTGQSPDGTTDTAANGAPQMQVYPSIKYVGNFGLLSLDQGNDGASTISSWITAGVSASDLQNEFSNGLLPLSKHNPLLWDWKGDPGLKTSDIHTLATEVGQTYLLPLFKPVNDGSLDSSLYAAGIGNGTNYFYNIVQFVGVTITAADDNAVHVQPTAVLNPNVVLTSITPAGPPTTSSVLVTTFATPKLSQ